MPDRTLPFLEGGGQLGSEIAGFDWASTPLGPIGDWPAALKVAVSTMLNSAFPKCLCWGPELVTIYNDAFVPILGSKHPCLGHPFSEIWSEAWDEIGPIARRAMAGKATFVEDFALTIVRSELREDVNFTFCYSPVRDEHGTVCGMLDTVVETTGKVRAERLAQLRNRELVHRSRNSLAVVSALVNQTCRTSATLEEAREKIGRRLVSLARAQDVLASSEVAEASVARVVERALEPFATEGSSVQAKGPQVRIGREQAVSLALAIHELATNAAKHGALSVPEGRASIAWDVETADGSAVFRLDWVESGGPTVVPPTRRGFGSFIIEQALSKEFGGRVEISYPPEGLRCSLSTDVIELTRE